MSQDTSRSEAVVEHYKRDKLAVSALRKIQGLIRGFEQERADDVRIARIGMILLLILIGIALFYFFGCKRNLHKREIRQKMSL